MASSADNSPVLSPAFEAPTHPDLDPCAICGTSYGELNDSEVMETPVSLACGHILGNYCIHAWLTTDGADRSCPLCRFPLTYRTCGHVIPPRPLANRAARRPSQEARHSLIYLDLDPAPPRLLDAAERPESCFSGCDDGADQPEEDLQLLEDRVLEALTQQVNLESLANIHRDLVGVLMRMVNIGGDAEEMLWVRRLMACVERLAAHALRIGDHDAVALDLIIDWEWN